jgi:YegS/Rv2252/BmrU family lipid kinase
MKHFFIVNPVAGKGKAMKLVPDIIEQCKARNYNYNIVDTGYPGHATEIAKQASDTKACRIYSVGGDGTLNEVLNGIAGSSSVLGVIPCGSGNDFIKSIIGSAIPDNILTATIEGKEKLIDYASVNDKYFVNISSVGFDAEVAYQTGHFKKLPLISGKMAYILGILTTILICKNHHMELKLDNETISGKSLLIAAGIGKYYGGGIFALPDAEIDDGLFDICHVDAMSRFKILRLFPQYMKGLHGNIKGVHLFKSKRVEIRSENPIPLNRDGEIILTDKAVFEIFPKSLPFIFPAL